MGGNPDSIRTSLGCDEVSGTIETRVPSLSVVDAAKSEQSCQTAEKSPRAMSAHSEE